MKHIKTEEEKSNSNSDSVKKTPLKYTSNIAATPSNTKFTPSTSKLFGPTTRFGEDDSDFNRHSERYSEDHKSDKSSYSVIVKNASTKRKNNLNFSKNN